MMNIYNRDTERFMERTDITTLDELIELMEELNICEERLNNPQSLNSIDLLFEQLLYEHYKAYALRYLRQHII